MNGEVELSHVPLQLSQGSSAVFSEVIVPLPKHTVRAIQEASELHSKSADLLGLNMHRLAALMEQELFSFESVQRAIHWTPEPGDIVIAASPRSGQSIVSLMVRLLCATNEEAFKEIVHVPDRSAPWLECRLVDEDPDCLIRKQPGTNRIFRTCMAQSALGTKIRGCPDSKFIVLFRNPLDIRMAWFEHLRSFFIRHQTHSVPGSTEEEWSNKFAAKYKPDDILHVPITLVHVSRK
jgi:hypothetical protein